MENDRTKLIVLGQIVHALFISNFILCTCMSKTIQTVHKTVAKSLHNPELSAIVDGEKKIAVSYPTA